MEPATQPELLKIPEQPPSRERAAAVESSPKLKPIDRDQSLLRPVIVEELVGPDHRVRAIWDLTGQLDLKGFYSKLKSRKGEAGRAAWDPRLLLSVWVYGYSEQVSSAREIERLMEYEPGFMWLSGLGEVNHHTLSDFRTEHAEALKKLLAELLGLLSQQGLVKLERVAHDGTRIRAQAGADSFRRQATLDREIERARQVIEELDQAGESDPDADRRRRQARQRRHAEERLERMKLAAKELEKIRDGKKGEEERSQARVSLSDPEARLMKHGDNAIAPSYNVQLSTDAAEKIIVGVHVTQSSSDSGSLKPAMDEIRTTAGAYPKQVVADGGFTNQASIAAMKEKQIEFYGSLPEAEVRQAAAMKSAGIDPAFGPARFVVLEDKQALQCPAGKTLTYVRQSTKRGDVYYQYQAAGRDCSGCNYRKQCCPGRPEQGRTVSVRMTENAEEMEFRQKMKSEEARAIYRERGPLAEFPNCWIKEKLGLRKFRLRGLTKVGTEALWAVLTYDILQWIRLTRKPAAVAA